MLDESSVNLDDVSDRNEWKVQPVLLSRFRIDAAGTGRAFAAAQNVRTNHEILVGVQAFTGTDKIVPPSRFLLFARVPASDVGIAR